MSSKPPTESAAVADGWAEGRSLANHAAAAMSKSPVPFTGALLLEGGWELHSPKYIADIGKTLDEGRRAKDALYDIMGAARKGLGI